MNKKYLVLFILLFFVGSCASTLSLRRNYIMTHPYLTPVEKQAVLRGDVIIGMDINTVIFVLGEPYRAVDKETARNDIQVLNFRDWDSGPGNFIRVTLVNDKVTTIERTYREPRPRPAREVIIVR